MRSIIISFLACLAICVLFAACGDKGTESASTPQNYEAVVFVAPWNGGSGYWVAFDCATDSLADSIANPLSNYTHSGPLFLADGETAYISMQASGSAQNMLLKTHWPTFDTIDYTLYDFCGECQIEFSPAKEAIFTQSGLMKLASSPSFHSLVPNDIDGFAFLPGAHMFYYFSLLSDTLISVEFGGAGFEETKHGLSDLSGAPLLIHSICTQVDGRSLIVTCQAAGDALPRVMIVSPTDFTIIDSLPLGDFAMVNNPVMTSSGDDIYWTPIPPSFSDRMVFEYDLSQRASRLVVDDSDLGRELYRTRMALSPNGRSAYFWGNTELNSGGTSLLYKLNLSSGEITELYQTKIDDVVRGVTFRPVE